MHDCSTKCKYANEMYELLTYIQRNGLNDPAVQWFIELMRKINVSSI